MACDKTSTDTFDLNEYIHANLIDELNDDDEVFGGNTKITLDFEPETPVTIDPELNENDMPTLLLAEVNRKGIAGNHINGMNTFYSSGLKQIVTNLFKAEVNNMKTDRDKQTKHPEDQEIEDISFKVEFTNVELKKPSTTSYSSPKAEALTPNIARLKNLTYSAAMYVEAKITTVAKLKNGKTRERSATIGTGDKKWRIASIPVMVKSNLCHLHGASRDAIKQMREDPNDPGGNFIIRGKDWSVDMRENMGRNQAYAYRNDHGKEVARLTFQSQPGDAYENSYYMVIKVLNANSDHQIIIQIVTNKFEQMEIPFYLIFRAFGMCRDRDIVDNIAYGGDDSVAKIMKDSLARAFDAPNKDFDPILKSRDPDEVLQFISKKMVDIANNPKLAKDTNAMKYVALRTVGMLDNVVFPHVGNSKEHRIKKLKFLGHLINKLLLVKMGILEGTDRDSYRNKRIHSAGVSLAKSVKTQYNFAVVQVIKQALIKEFKNTRWSQVPLAETVRSAVRIDDLSNGLERSIITGESKLTVNRNEVVNRVSSQQIHRKNDQNVHAILNNIATHGASQSKSNDRAQDMRMPHPSYYGYIGMAQSADTGEKVGMSKQLAVSASVAEASSSYAIKEILANDDTITPLDTIHPTNIAQNKLTKVFVNGDWVGLCENGAELVKKYRTARRHNIIWYETTIVWEYLTREVYFCSDVGRLIRPLVIVYNNIDECKAAWSKGKNAKFKQWILLKKSHIRELQAGFITMEDLRNQRIIEYVSPEESENLIIARSLDVLKANLNKFTLQYTHCDIEQAMFGLIELSAPNTNHTPASRITMFTNHKKQTCGWYALNFPDRIDKNVFVQYYCDNPTVRAFSNALSYPNSENLILAYTPAIGFGQEDSVHINKSSIDLGLFNGSHYHFEQTELERGERFGNPDQARTIDRKSHAIYEHIDENGFIRVGTVVRKGYVLVVKSANLNPPVDQFIYTDNSLIYKLDEPAIVERVIHPRNDDDIRIAKIKLRSFRPLRVGDKLSSHSGCKGITAVMLNRADMPYCIDDGTIPDAILNPHSVPTRMVIGQIIETMMAELAVRMGCMLDGTPFRKLDIDGMIEKLATDYGIEYGGHRRMYNGKTGNYYDAMIFVGPTAYQRLQKFVIDENYAMSTGPTCALTRQPLDGKANNGGLRLGEMEKDVFVANGIMRTLMAKFYRDSDGIDMYICRCGNRAIINERAGMYKCKHCRDDADIVKVPSSYVANLFLNEINAMGVKATFKLEPIGYSQQ